MKILTVGASGFIGSHVMAAGEALGLDMAGASGIRVDPRYAAQPDAPVAWCRDNEALLDAFCGELDGYEVVINAAGRADPGARDTASLMAANALQPAIVATACRLAGVRRLVHISTAAVQGRMDPLDETARHEPLSPYAASKAQGERYLLDPDLPAPAEVVVYRATSVHASGRQATYLLARLASLPAVPISGDGDQPVPVALIENVAAAVMFAATDADLLPSGGRVVTLHPSDVLTARRLLELLGARRLIAVPSAVTEAALRAITGTGTRWPGLVARSRWLELLWRGQSVDAKMLAGAGFTEPVGHAAWTALGRNGLAATQL